MACCYRVKGSRFNDGDLKYDPLLIEFYRTDNTISFDPELISILEVMAIDLNDMKRKLENEREIEAQADRMRRIFESRNTTGKEKKTRVNHIVKRT